MFTNGTVIAVTDNMSAMLNAALGITPQFGPARVLGADPESLPEGVEGEGYIVEPILHDGSTPPGYEDVALRVLVNPESPKLDTAEVGRVHPGTFYAQISKSEYLALVSARIESEVEQAYAELQDELNAFAAQQDDDLDPEFFEAEPEERGAYLRPDEEG